MPSISSPVDGAHISYTDYLPLKATSTETKPFVPPSPLTTNPSSTSPNPRAFTLVFIHGWPMSAEMYTQLMLPFSQNHNIRCIAPDRRGFGKSEWVGSNSSGEDPAYDTFAKDTLAVIEAARIEGPWALVGASMGCGESLLVYELLEEGLRECVSLSRTEGSYGLLTMLTGAHSAKGSFGWVQACHFHYSASVIRRRRRGSCGTQSCRVCGMIVWGLSRWLFMVCLALGVLRKEVLES